MSNEKNNVPVSDEEMVVIFRENDKVLMELLTRIKNISANTLMVEKQVKIDALRRAIVNKDIQCQLEKIQMMQEVLKELE